MWTYVIGCVGTFLLEWNIHQLSHSWSPLHCPLVTSGIKTLVFIGHFLGCAFCQRLTRTGGHLFIRLKKDITLSLPLSFIRSKNFFQCFKCSLLKLNICYTIYNLHNDSLLTHFSHIQLWLIYWLFVVSH